MLKILQIILAFFLIASGAYAETIPATSQPVVNEVQIVFDNNSRSLWAATPQLACTSSGYQWNYNASVGVTYCYKSAGDFSNTTVSRITTPYVCPTGQNWTLSGSTCTRPNCVLPQVRNPATGVCEAPKCTSTASTEGTVYAPSRPNFPYATCVDGCRASLALTTGAPNSTACKVVNGITNCPYGYLYYKDGKGFSDVCTAGTGPNDVIAPPTNQPNAPTETCASGSGMIKVDGKTTCISNSTGKPLSTDPPKVETTTNNSNTVTNPDNTKTVTSTTTNTTTGGTTTTTNVYGAGVDPANPASVPISTTTATTGGGAGTGTGTKGNGDGNDAHCGATGQPPCKIDEAGTPTDASLQSQKDGFDSAAESRTNSITNIGSSQKVQELPWTWNFQVPTGTCEAIDVSIPGGRGGSLDMCTSPVIQGMRSILSWVYFVLFSLFAWRRFTESVGK